MEILVTCYTCGGTGVFPPGSDVVCHTCDGTETITAEGVHSITQAIADATNLKVIDMTEKMNDMEDKIDDVMDKLDDIIEKLNE